MAFCSLQGFTSHYFHLVLQPLGLYKGVLSPLYGLAAINAIVFGVQANVQRRLNNPDSIQSHALAGSIAGAAQCVICSPMELAKTRLQIQGLGESRRHFRSHKHTYDGPWDCMRKIYRSEGIRGVYRGFLLTCLREMPSFGVYFASYEVFCRVLSPDETEMVSTPVLLLAGGLSGMCSWTSTYPIDVIKSRVQADMSGKYKGFVHCCRVSYEELGMGVFTRGLPSTLLRAFPVNAATFATVTWSLRWMRADRDDDDYYDDLYTPPDPQTAMLMPHVPNFPSHP
jgi:solute carrier family 25 carnitine/acylcarnitine transporter 20/29